MGDATVGASALVGRTLLVVDDSDASRELLSVLLRLGGADVIELDNGAAALDEAIRTRYDAVLMDVQMPVMDGLDATRRIRLHESEVDGLEPMLVIGVTAHAMADHEDECLEAGMDHVLSKPIDPSRIALSVATMIDEHEH